MSRTTTRRRIRWGTLAALAACTSLASSLLLGSSAAAAPAEADEYVAMGDSYSSGNGTFAPNLSLACYRSTFAYPFLVAEQRPHTDLDFVACQGAQTGDVLAEQVRSLDADTDHVSITIGGNDIGFGNLIVSCSGAVSPNCRAAVDESNRRIADELPGKLDETYAAISAGAPNAEEVVVVGYGRFFGPDLSCPQAFGTTRQEAEWLNGLADNLDAAIADRATAAGFTYASSIARFTGHDICASDPYLNGRSVSVADMFHPTRSGHANGLAPLVLDALG